MIKEAQIVEEVLKIENISKTYQAKNGEIESLKNVNLQVYKGELLSIIGPSRMWEINITFNNSRIRRKNSWKDLYRRKRNRKNIIKDRIYASKR